MSDFTDAEYDVVVIGAGAAGLMCAIEAAKRKRSVLLLEQADKVGKKILISGGGRCNFTNLFAAPDRYLSDNRHFCKSALRAYTQSDFIELVRRYGIAYHEKKLGQLFCDESSQNIIDLLLSEAEKAGVRLHCDRAVKSVKASEKSGFVVNAGPEAVTSNAVVVATGGLSIPKLGANDFAYRLARQFDLKVTQTRPGLVPFTFDAPDLERFAGLTGISADVVAKIGKTSFRENVLFTHRGVSGPAILQISSFWKEGDVVHLDFLPDEDVLGLLQAARKENPKGRVRKILSQYLANRLVEKLLEKIEPIPELGNCSDKLLRKVDSAIKQVIIKPNGTEGYRKAEVTVGGVCTSEISSKTMEAKKVSGLYFIGEAVDVTGFLGGYNFQWAWSSGFVAGQNV
ncbi:NAD(P)/FAD-dependent oxidoreductase [Sneathiella glossodoripedis]|uniref:NAD(P)/FAD-dependent oxidoreductase n=1 Tax=Sneathiella glossodoripedis TaxID=418853 RepID=UPI00046F116D|nr:NAD(P)/FAD-dependent oxidoreductase [Sneathiella glossodoripedis]